MLLNLQPCAAGASLIARLGPTAALTIAGRAFATVAGTPAATQGSSPGADWQQRFEAVTPGSVLRIDLPKAVDLKVHVGEHEAIELSSPASLATEQAPHDGHPGSSLVTVSECVGQHSAEAATTQPLPLRVWGPSRFFSIEARTAGGSVAVESIQEGSLRLETGGGDVSMPKVKAVDAHVSTGGGAISGSVTGVDVRLRTAGGAVRLKGLVGKAAEVDSGGGGVTLGACYADQLHVQSGGGPIAITNMDCRSGVAALRSSGGPVSVDSLDGNLTIDSAGGDVQVQLHDNAGTVAISSGGGDIRLFLNPAVSGRLLLRNCARVAARPGAVRVAHPQADGALLLPLPLGNATGAAAAAAEAAGASGVPSPLSRLQRAAAAAAGPQLRPQAGPPPGNVVTTAARQERLTGADIVLDAGGRGTVSISERSWMEALRQRYS